MPRRFLRYAGRLNSGVMLHRNFPDGVTTATICTYFQVGIEAGLVPYENSKDWAFSVIEQLDAPPIEIIEIATANQRNASLEALHVVAGGADGPMAGRLLLQELLFQFKAGSIPAIHAVRMAMRVVRATGMQDSIYYDFDILEDELVLVANDVYGTPEALSTALARALEQHAGAT